MPGDDVREKHKMLKMKMMKIEAVGYLAVP
jgi:hypothetical protein